MKFVKAFVAIVIGVPTTKNMISPAMIADNVGTIIIGINASAHLGTFRLFLMNNAM